MNDNIPKSQVLLEEMLPSSSVPMRVLPLLISSLRRYLWPNPKEGVAVPAGLSNRTLFSAAVCSALCVALSLTAVVAVQIAFSRVDRNNRLGLSQDCFYAISGWTFLLYDLFHSYVIGVFAFWLVRSLCWEAWIGGSALIISSLADIGSLSVDMFLQTPALSALANGRSAGFPHPEAGYDVICSTLDFTQASFGLVGSFFLAGAAMKVAGPARLAGWFIIAGFPISIFQIAEVGLHTPWTAIVDNWVTPLSEIMVHVMMAVCLWNIFRQKSVSSDSQPMVSPRLENQRSRSRF
jgi:hypothetical protein